MNKTRILIVDDSVVVRRLVSDVLSNDSELEVVGVAANGRLALQKIEQLAPDVVTLDIEMPEMDGLAALAEIRKTHPRLPVIMFSTLTERGARATFDALKLGASDYVTKPSGAGNAAEAAQSVREQLIPRIKEFCRKTQVTPAAPPAARRHAEQTAERNRANFAPSRVEVLAIGVSTGGPNALEAVLPRLPANFPVPVVIVQHMPAVFTKLLAARLDAQSAIRVVEGSHGEALRPGHAYFAPGGFHMIVERDGGRVSLLTNLDPPENSCRPAVDVLFRSVAAAYGAHTLAVVLTGMGQDGLLGCEMIRAKGGQILVQDQATSVVWGMPGAIAKADLADHVLPLDQIAPSITRRVKEIGAIPVAAA